MTDVHDVFHRAETHGHFVQFYKADEPLLNRNVGNFLWDGLLRGDGLLVIATRQRRESLSSHLSRLGADVVLARREGQLAMLDADEVLARFMVNGQPDWDRFQDATGEALQLARPRTTNAGTCEIGEFTPADYECICRSYLEADEADRLDYAKIHRFAPALNAHQLKNACVWLARKADLDSDRFIEYLSSQNMTSNVDIKEVPAELRQKHACQSN